METSCECCQNIIPKFELLPKEDENYIRQLIRDGKPVSAIVKLKNITQTSLMEARIWVEHSGEFTHRKTIPCLYCGELLRTFEAKQCRFCLRDWHDENNVKFLK